MDFKLNKRNTGYEYIPTSPTRAVASCMPVCVSVCACVRACMCAYVHVSVCVHVCMPVCMTCPIRHVCNLKVCAQVHLLCLTACFQLYCYTYTIQLADPSSNPVLWSPLPFYSNCFRHTWLSLQVNDWATTPLMWPAGLSSLSLWPLADPVSPALFCHVITVAIFQHCVCKCALVSVNTCYSPKENVSSLLLKGGGFAIHAV